MSCAAAKRIMSHKFWRLISIPREFLTSRARFNFLMARRYYFFNCNLTTSPNLGGVTPVSAYCLYLFANAQQKWLFGAFTKVRAHHNKKQNEHSKTR